jgi:hypothetical protein
LPALSSRVGYGISRQDSAEVLLESTGDSVFEGKRDWRCAQCSRSHSSEVRILHQVSVAILPGLDGRPWRSRYFSETNRIVGRRCGWRVVLCISPYSAEKSTTKQD